MTTPLRVLIVEDTPDDAELMALRLEEEGFRPEWQRAETEAEYLAALEPPPDLILADWTLPGFSGLRALGLMRQRGLDIPFIIVSGSIGEEAAIDALRQGAYDYVIKDRPARLGPAVRHALEDKLQREERRRAEETLRKRARQLAMLNEIGGRVAALLDLDQLLDRAAHLVQERFGFHHVGLFTRVAGEDRLVMRARAGEFAALFPPDHSLALGQGMVGWVGLHGQTLLANDVTAEPRHFNPYHVPTRSELSVPIRIGTGEGQVVGVLDLQSPQLNAFDDNDVTTLETLADQLAVAIHNARLFEAERTAREQTERLLAATQALGATLNLQETLERILSELRHVVPYDSASVQLLRGERLEIIGGNGFPNLEELLGVSFDLTADDCPNGEVIRNRAPLILADAWAAYEAFRREPHAQAGIRAWLGVPLLYGEQPIGMIALDKQQPGFFTRDHVFLAQAFAAQAAIAIENARLYAEAQRRNRELALLNRVIAATATGETLKPILEVVCRELGLAFEVPQVTAALFNPEKTKVVIVAEYRTPGRPSLLDTHIPVANCPASQHLLTHKAPMIQEIQADAPPAAPWESWQKRGTASLLVLPLVVDGELVGSLSMEAVTPRAFSSDEVNLAWRVAEQMSGVLARARLREERRQLEEQFHQAQKMEAVGRLAGGVAHDFNNLMTVINLSSRLLERKLRPEDPLWDNVQRIKEAGQRAADLTRQLLAFSRREILKPQVVDLKDLIGNLSKMLKRLIGEDIELEVRLANGLWPVRVDPTQIEQVVVNLAVNARDAMPGGGRLTIETANVVLDAAYAAHHLGVKPGDYVLLTLSDTGVGMDDEVKAHLFEPFFTTKERGKGTGLGLATVFGIVKQNLGHISVHSEVGKGTDFQIYLPRAEAMAQAGAEAEVEGSTLPPTPPSASPSTILLVEDEAQVQEITRQVLMAQGYQVLTARDGAEALQVAQDHQGPIHLLLTDVVMPRLGGRELANRLRPGRPEMQVLFTSGYTDDTILHHGALDKGVHFLSKPFDLEALIGKVHEVLRAPTRPSARAEKEPL